MNFDIESFRSKLSAVTAKLESLKADYPALIDETLTSIRTFEDAAEKTMEEGRRLSISIVGRVKSGKSSLLNALLFDGESILPQAATPMTAALTFIRYAPECRAEIEFFAPGDWEVFVHQAAEYDRIFEEAKRNLAAEEDDRRKRAEKSRRLYREREITKQRIIDYAKGQLNENFIAAHELVEMARNSGLHPEEFLGKQQTVIHAANPVELAGKLEEYVGADGKFTPIVCSTAIYINDPRLDGYEIIDTPGTNDPVISRGQRTKQHLKNTDVVLALSNASNFFNQSDLELLSQNLPQSGVKDFLLIASQFDLTIGEHENKIPYNLPPKNRLVKAFIEVQNLIKENFHNRVEEIARQATLQKNADADKWNFLLNADAICVSAMAFTLAKHWDYLNEKERENLERFNELIPGYTFDRQMMLEFSRMDKVHGEVGKVKDRKAEILAQALQNKVEGAKQGFAELAKTLRDTILNTIGTLESKDVVQLAKELKAQTSRIEKGRSTLEGCFEDEIYNARTKFRDILAEIRREKATFTNVNVQSESKQESYTVDKGCGFLGWRSLTGNRYETRYRTVTTKYADAYDSVDQVQNFAAQSQDMLEKEIKDVVDVNALKNKISDAVLSLFQDNMEEIDLDLLKVQIQSAIRRITIPDADFGNKDYSAVITAKFSGSRVEASRIDELKKVQREALQAVINDLEATTKDKITAIETCLNNTMTSFVNQLIGDLTEENRKLAEQLQNKESNLKHQRSLLPVAEEIETMMKQL